MLAIRFILDPIGPGESPNLARGWMEFRGAGGRVTSADPPRDLILIASVATFLDAVTEILSTRSRRAVEFVAVGEPCGRRPSP